MLASSPEPGATNVSPDLRPWILLNEYPQRNAVPGTVFISPLLDGGFETRVKGKRLEVRFTKPLPENRTIVITFGTGLKDMVGNPMPQPYVLAFATGDSLDRAEIEGDIYGMEDPLRPGSGLIREISIRVLIPLKIKHHSLRNLMKRDISV